MNLVRRSLLVCAAIAALFSLSLGNAQAARPTLSEPAISPDGRTIAFVSGGSVWTAPASGGTARILVNDRLIGDRPLYSPDGSQLAFVSYRNGPGDVYVLTLATGALARLTYDDSTEWLEGWRDGFIYFSSPSNNINGERDIYRVRSTGGTPMLYVAQPYLTEFFGAPAPDGHSIAFNVRGLSGGQWWRVGRSHIDESEIWLRRGDGPNPTFERLTDGGAREDWAMWAPDGKRIYYMSDRSGAQNIWTRTIGETAHQVTHFTNGRVVWPTISRDGGTIAFERDFGVWKLETASGHVAPVQLVLQGVVSQPQVQHTISRDGFGDYRISPDGKKVAFLAHGQIFASSTNGGVSIRVTGQDEYAREFAWAPDSNSLAFASGDGHEDRIYRYDFVSNGRKTLVATPADIRYLTYSPASKARDEKLAYEQAGAELRVLDLATGEIRTVARGYLPLTPGESESALAWSPDAAWIAYLANDAVGFENVTVVNVANPSPRTISYAPNAYANAIAWNPDGKSIVFSSDERTEPWSVARIDLIPRTPTFGEDRLHALFSRDGDYDDAAAASPAAAVSAGSSASAAAKPAPKPVKIVFENIHDRMTYLPTGLNAASFAISSDGRTAAFAAQNGNDQNLYLYALDPNVHAVARQITSSPGGKNLPQWAPDGKSIYYLDDDLALQHVALDDDNKVNQVALAAEYDVDWNRDKVEAFDEAWSAIRDFYADPHTNGVDWKNVRERYAPQIAGAQNPGDLNRLLNLMVGELNSSHSGAYPPYTFRRTEGRIGVTFERAPYERDGRFVVATVVPQSPAAIAGIVPGDRITSIGGVALDPTSNADRLFDNTGGKKLSIGLASPSGTRDVAVKPVDYGTIGNLRYRAWIAQNRATVDRLSGGKLGYVHIPDMTAESLDQFYKDLDAIQFGKQGVVIDVRSNNGGFVNAYALDVLSRQAYLTFTGRNQPTYAVREQLGQHALGKPTVLITNEETLSDGEDFTEGYRAMHLGKVVGEPTAGWIIFTSAITLVDGTTFRMPAWAVTTASGAPMERHPRPVDVTVQRQVGSSEDAQLAAAVRTLLESVR
jgi:tricorn protease